MEARLADEAPPELNLTAHRGRELIVRVPHAVPLHVDDDPWAGDRDDGEAVVIGTGPQVRVLVPG